MHLRAALYSLNLVSVPNRQEPLMHTIGARGVPQTAVVSGCIQKPSYFTAERGGSFLVGVCSSIRYFSDFEMNYLSL